MKNEKNEIVIFTDGACSGNPGPGGWAAIISINQNNIIELGGGKKNTTNNHMELYSVLESLDYVNEYQQKIAVYTDSTYVINGVTKWMWGWVKKNWITSENNSVSNKEIWEQIYKLVLSKKNKISWHYVRGHTGVVGNERCDQIAVGFSKGDEVYLYEGDYLNYSYKIFPLPTPEPVPEFNFNKKDSGKDNSSYYISWVNGVFSKHQTWIDCERRVKGVSGAKFKKVKSQLEEEQVLQDWKYGNKK